MIDRQQTFAVLPASCSPESECGVGLIHGLGSRLEALDHMTVLVATSARPASPLAGEARESPAQTPTWERAAFLISCSVVIAIAGAENMYPGLLPHEAIGG